MRHVWCLVSSVSLYVGLGCGIHWAGDCVLRLVRLDRYGGRGTFATPEGEPPPLAGGGGLVSFQFVEDVDEG